MDKQEQQREAYSRAHDGESTANYDRIMAGFIAKGIPEIGIIPRENVFTYGAWRHEGRQVRRGEHGVKVMTFVKDEKTGRSYAKRTAVFHISQTDAREQKYVAAEVIHPAPEPVAPAADRQPETLTYRRPATGNVVSIRNPAAQPAPADLFDQFAPDEDKS